MTFRQRIKLGIYATAKWTGLFSVSRVLMRRRLMILGYHGFQHTDEARFRPVLFMEPECFSRRLDILARRNYPALSLAEGVRRLKNGTLPANAVVITFDDGYFSVLDSAAPMLKKHDFPATLYVTTYYVIKGTPIFRLVIQYLFWKTERTSLEAPDFLQSSSSVTDLGDVRAASRIMWEIIDHGEASCDEVMRQSICTEVAAALDVDYETIIRDRGLSLMTPDELLQLEEFGIDVQLHTHRHIFPPDDPEQARGELRENRIFLEKLLGRQLEHFCYPSGIWTRDILPVLAGDSILSAATCQAAMNDRATSSLALYRVLDQNDLHDIEFEAELSGFCELLRIVSGKRRRMGIRHAAEADSIPSP